MAKIKYSALINTISGKLGGSVLTQCKGINYIRKQNSSPSQLRSSDQVKLRGINNDLSSNWYSLSEDKKSLWRQFASKYLDHGSGINAYVSLNSKIFLYFGKSSIIDTPPPTPGTPKHFKKSAIIFDGNGHFIVDFSSPADANTSIIMNHKYHLPIYRKHSIKWHKSGVFDSENSSFLYTPDFLFDRSVDFRFRSIDQYGRQSPFSTMFTYPITDENAGVSWTDLGQQDSLSDIFSFTYLGNGICLAGVGGGGKILRSTDYGQTWTSLGSQFSQVQIKSLCYLGNGICLSGTHPGGKILRSTDYGQSWSDLGTQFSQSRIYSLLYLGNGVCLAGTYPNAKILRSTDYGQTWTSLGPQFSQSHIYSFSYLGNGICLAGTASGGRILRSLDYGQSWTDLGQQATETNIFTLSYLYNGICLAGTGTHGKILRSTDYGKTWIDLGQQFSESAIYSLLYLGNGVCLAGTGQNGKILRSTDYGQSWTDLGTQFSQTHIWSLAYLVNGVCLAGTRPNGKILRSTV